jgi:hypothetical protein
MKTVKYELKYCEGCGTLKLRPVYSANNYCLRCERMLARFRFPRRARVIDGAGLPSRAELKLLAEIPLSVYGVMPAGRVQ